MMIENLIRLVVGMYLIVLAMVIADKKFEYFGLLAVMFLPMVVYIVKRKILKLV
jgi:hypothetical protein